MYHPPEKQDMKLIYIEEQCTDTGIFPVCTMDPEGRRLGHACIVCPVARVPSARTSLNSDSKLAAETSPVSSRYSFQGSNKMEMSRLLTRYVPTRGATRSRIRNIRLEGGSRLLYCPRGECKQHAGTRLRTYIEINVEWGNEHVRCGAAPFLDGTHIESAFHGRGRHTPRLSTLSFSRSVCIRWTIELGRLMEKGKNRPSLDRPCI